MLKKVGYCCCCGAQAHLLHHIWDLPRPGIEPKVPALAGTLPTTGPPGKSLGRCSCAQKVHCSMGKKDSTNSSIPLTPVSLLPE